MISYFYLHETVLFVTLYKNHESKCSLFMIKDELINHFSSRLRDSMLAAGHHSQRSPSGVNLHKLAEITGYSLQICRKYLRGEALPEPRKIAEIASKLNVSPGWLLFGDEPREGLVATHQITISKSLLLYLYTQASKLYITEHDDTPEFLLALTKDISEIDASEAQSKRIIDLALSSAHHFHRHHG